MQVLITGAAGNAGQAICALLAKHGKYALRMCDVTAPPPGLSGIGEYHRCDT